MSLCSVCASRCRTDAPLAEHTWYRLGGAARWLAHPESREELAALLNECAQAGIEWRMLGRGANILVTDTGFDGLVIKLDAPAFKLIDWSTDGVTAGAGVDAFELVKASATRGYRGLEALAGIPGLVGGLVRMNAGGKYGCVADSLARVEVMTPQGAVRQLEAGALELRYRHAKLDGAIVLSATFALEQVDPEQALARFREIWREKHAAQPAVAARSAGCIFKNPPNDAAGRLIDLAGLKGTRIGGAEVAEAHANFILAYEDCTSADILELVAHVQQRVRGAFNVELELEVDVW